MSTAITVSPAASRRLARELGETYLADAGRVTASGRDGESAVVGSIAAFDDVCYQQGGPPLRGVGVGEGTAHNAERAPSAGVVAGRGQLHDRATVDRL